LLVVVVFRTNAFQPILTAISSFSFQQREKITLVEGLVITKLEGFVQGRNASVPYANEIEGDLAELFSGDDDEAMHEFSYDLAFYRPEGGDGLYDYEQFKPSQ
jgi:hypothetical protein